MNIIFKQMLLIEKSRSKKKRHFSVLKTGVA